LCSCERPDGTLLEGGAGALVSVDIENGHLERCGYDHAAVLERKRCGVSRAGSSNAGTPADDSVANGDGNAGRVDEHERIVRQQDRRPRRTSAGGHAPALTRVACERENLAPVAKNIRRAFGVDQWALRRDASKRNLPLDAQPALRETRFGQAGPSAIQLLQARSAFRCSHDEAE
jgi:hypothetical protein